MADRSDGHATQTLGDDAGLQPLQHPEAEQLIVTEVGDDIGRRLVKRLANQQRLKAGILWQLLCHGQQLAYLSAEAAPRSCGPIKLLDEVAERKLICVQCADAPDQPFTEETLEIDQDSISTAGVCVGGIDANHFQGLGDATLFEKSCNFLRNRLRWFHPSFFLWNEVSDI